MKRTLLLAMLVSLLFSCKKDELVFPHTGNWKFSGATAVRFNTYINTDPSADYDSIVYVYRGSIFPLTGTVDITKAVWDYTEAQYTCEEKVETITYKNGNIAFSNVQALPGITLTTKRRMEFKVIHADSVYFHAKDMEEDDSYLVPLPMQNTGATIKVKADTMYVRMLIPHYDKNLPNANMHAGRLEKTLKYIR